MKTELRPLLDFGLPETVELLNLGFSDYLAHLEFSLLSFLDMVRTESIDLAASRIVAVQGEGAGVALIARRGWTSRLAAMCLSPHVRGRGAGRAAMQLLLEEAAGRAEPTMVLEVIETNTPAVRLYEGIGFRAERRLLSYVGEFSARENPGADQLEDMDIRAAAGWVSMYGPPDLPWQLSAESLAHIGPPNRAFCLNDACLVISDPNAEMVGIRSLIVKPESRGQNQAARLLQAITARYPDRQWRVPALCPEEYGGFFIKFGFQPGRFSQLQMRAKIDLQPK